MQQNDSLADGQVLKATDEAEFSSKVDALFQDMLLDMGDMREVRVRVVRLSGAGVRAA